MNDHAKTDPPPAGIVPSVLPEHSEEPTGNLKKDADIARLIQEIHNKVSQSYVPLRTDLSDLNARLDRVIDALETHTNNELRIEARLKRLENALNLLPLPESEEASVDSAKLPRD